MTQIVSIPGSKFKAQTSKWNLKINHRVRWDGIALTRGIGLGFKDSRVGLKDAANLSEHFFA